MCKCLLRSAFAFIFLFLLSFLTHSPATAQQSTLVEAFIARVKMQHSFKPVALWQTDKAADAAATASYVSQAAFFQLDLARLGTLMEQRERGIRLQLTDGAGRLFTLDMARYDILAAGFSLQENNGEAIVARQYAPGLFYRGVVNEYPGSLAAFSFFEGELYGVFSIPGQGNFSLVPNTLVAGGKAGGHYLLYNDADLKIRRNTPPCGSDELIVNKLADPAVSAKLAYSNCKDVEVLLQADYDTYAAMGSNTTTVANYLSSVFNVLSVLYRNEGIYTSIKAIRVNTATDAYQTLNAVSLDFLKKFGELTQGNMAGADLAHLVSTRYNGGMGGIAWVNMLCLGYQGAAQHAGPYAFSNIYAGEAPGTFPTYTWNVECMTHEMGHSLGSAHTHNCTAWTGGPIDGCAPTANAAYAEGSCATGPVPSPAVKGTIMSYCHLLAGVGINFSNGFGSQPGDLIRARVSNAACATNYIADTVLTIAGTQLWATRECTDASGLTYYWNDNDNADETDDRLVLKMIKGGNAIGTLDDVGFAVKTVTLPAYGSSYGTLVSLPAGLPNTGGLNVSMNRYWQVTPLVQPATPVEVQFPFTQQDIGDIAGSIPSMGNAYTGLRFYKAGQGINPDPAAGFTGATTANMTTYSYGTTPGLQTWAYSGSGNTRFARFLVNAFSGGGGYGMAGIPLPLELIWFRGVVRNGAVSLDWEVAGERDIREYIVERSADGRDYREVSIVAARGPEAVLYNTMDRQPLQGNSYYRLSVISIDGVRKIVAYSHVVMQRSGGISMYPNPAKGILHISRSGTAGSALLRIMDMNGRVVLNTQLYSTESVINVGQLAKGIYNVLLISDRGTIREQLLIE